MGRRGPVVGHQLARGHPLGQLRRAAAAEVGTLDVLGARGQLPVEEHRQLELLADQRRGGQRLGARRAAHRLVEVDQRSHVERAHVRVQALVASQVDAVERGARGRRAVRAQARPDDRQIVNTERLWSGST